MSIYEMQKLKLMYSLCLLQYSSEILYGEKMSHKSVTLLTFLVVLIAYLFFVVVQFFLKDLGQFPIQSAQILTACG